MVSRLILLLWICSARGLAWCVEQPASSVMECHARFQAFVDSVRVFKTHVHMGRSVRRHISRRCCTALMSSSTS